MNNFYYKYKSMNWYQLLGFDDNERSKRMWQGKPWTTEEIEKNYQNCLALLNRSNLTEINSFYKKNQFSSEKLENLSELREKIQLAYDTLINSEQRKEYDLEAFGIFYYDYPANEMADENFKLKAIKLLEEFLQDELDEKLGHSYWKNYLSGYWQNWQETVKNTKYKEEIRFFVHRFHELRMFILGTTGWGKERDQKYVRKNASELIEQEKIRLQNITKEEWDKWIEKTRTPMSEEDIEWVAGETLKVLEKVFVEGENTNSHPPQSTLKEEKNRLKEWMKQENIEEIILQRKNVALCKKCNGSGSLYFGSEPVGSEEIPETLRTKINGVDIGLFFEKIGKKSISRQELDQPLKINNSEKNNFNWTPWLVGGGIATLLIISLSLIIRKKRKNNVK